MKAISMMRDFGGKINKNPRHTKDVEKQCGRYGKIQQKNCFMEILHGFFSSIFSSHNFSLSEPLLQFRLWLIDIVSARDAIINDAF